MFDRQEQASWKMAVESYGKDLQPDEIRGYYESFTKSIHILGPVRMKNPEFVVSLAFDYGHIGSGRLYNDAKYNVLMVSSKAGLSRSIFGKWSAIDCK